jgi:hypothetical protein
MADEIAAAAARAGGVDLGSGHGLSRSRRIAEPARRIMTLPPVSDGRLTKMPPERSSFRRRARVCTW